MRIEATWKDHPTAVQESAQEYIGSLQGIATSGFSENPTVPCEEFFIDAARNAMSRHTENTEYLTVHQMNHFHGAVRRNLLSKNIYVPKKATLDEVIRMLESAGLLGSAREISTGSEAEFVLVGSQTGQMTSEGHIGEVDPNTTVPESHNREVERDTAHRAVEVTELGGRIMKQMREHLDQYERYFSDYDVLELARDLGSPVPAVKASLGKLMSQGLISSEANVNEFYNGMLLYLTDLGYDAVLVIKQRRR